MVKGELERLMAALEGDLVEVEAKRKRALQVGFAAVAALPLSFGGLAALHLGELAGIGTIVLTAIGLGIFAAYKHDFACSYKRLVIGRLVKRLDPSMTYAPDGYVEVEAFSRSLQASTDWNRYRGEDHIEGTYRGLHRCVSELDVRCKEGKHEHVVFKGLFAEQELQEPIDGHVVIVPDQAEQLFGRFAAMFQRRRTERGVLVRFDDDPPFEKRFAVYASDERLARAMLPPGRRAQLVALATERCAHGLGVSFVETMAYVAITCHHDMFEPSLLRSANDPGPLKTYVQDLRFAMGLMGKLGLETATGGAVGRREA